MNPKQALAALSLFALIAVAALPSVAAHNPKVTIPTAEVTGIVTAAGDLPAATQDNVERGLARIEQSAVEIQNTPPGEIPLDQVHSIVLDGVVGIVQDQVATLSAFATGPVGTGANAIVDGKLAD